MAYQSLTPEVLAQLTAALPGSVLSGGQYDTLMKKMGRKDRAIGFAVFLDMLERLTEEDDFRA